MNGETFLLHVTLIQANKGTEVLNSLTQTIYAKKNCKLSNIIYFFRLHPDKIFQFNWKQLANSFFLGERNIYVKLP